MADRTIVSRVARQREKRKAAGWHEVKVWVPKTEQADVIRDYAASCRARLPDETRIIAQEKESATNFGFERTVTLSRKLFGEVSHFYPDLHSDACYMIVDKVLKSLRILPPKGDVTITLVEDGSEIYRQVVDRHMLDKKFVIHKSKVFTGPHHVMDDIWSYYQEDTNYL